ncbi:3-deoxy-manno-octulosonate cytidylyltransferase [uncultured Desulfovibrio sp.]|uniref:3-deoxy-manno-octulosonate cytidylyltransferase n=1 Tax=uncultured Desulfovibrio sp. TaxID=167968 RepID=UPI0026053AAB|nr:3-deoxy-manno-octulosonate cytidylyltransferase [uncultured Desulfovibrio sp.]
MKAVAVIPARYASTRLPGKPLLDICGKPLIQRVWDIVSRARGLDDVVVATDDVRIADAVERFGGRVCMTSPECQSGSDRVREVAESLAADLYVNVQGDEPLLEPAAIERLLDVFTEDAGVQVATLCSRISEEQARSPHQVKVIRDHAGNALYFSRAPLPFVRERGEPAEFWGHVGVYAYRADALRGFASLPPSPLEQAEKLEQLRFLQAGIAIRVPEVPLMGAGVDTQEDLERVRAFINGREHANAATAGTVAVGDLRRPVSACPVGAARLNPALAGKLRHIRLVITDVDGVLTDGGLYYGPDGECLKRFHARDGLGVRLLQQAGIQVSVLSGRDCPALRRRLADLGIAEAVLGQADKRTALSGIIERCGVVAEEVAFIGDDIPDMEVFGLCGVSVTVADAPEYVKARADLVLKCGGGQGAFREMVDILFNIIK